jgi:hypothetical protein
MPLGKRLSAQPLRFETIFLVTTIVFALITIALVVTRILT